MKTMQSITRKFMLPAALALVSMFSFSSCDKDDDDDIITQPNYTISGNAAGSQVVPSVAGTGTGSITGTYNPNNKLLTYTAKYDSLSGAPTGGGFYNGATGVAGTSVGTPWAFDSTATSTGTYSGTMTLTDDQATQLTSGNWYYGYNTSTNTTGEIRGQITATQ
jgi:hypothetical protein